MCTVGVVVLGKYLMKRKAAKSGNSMETAGQIQVTEQVVEKE